MQICSTTHGYVSGIKCDGQRDRKGSVGIKSEEKSKGRLK